MRLRARLKELVAGRLRFPATLCQLVNYLAQTAVNVYIVVWSESAGIGNGALYFAVMAVAMCVIRLFSGRLMEAARSACSSPS
ncbi:MAG: hypothetical protein ACOX69_08670 [Coriobacteriales bacterium]